MGLPPGMAVFHGKISEITRSISRTLLDYTAISRRNKTEMVMKIHNFPVLKYNKPGPAQVGAISKAQNSKRTSKCQSIGELATPLL